MVVGFGSVGVCCRFVDASDHEAPATAEILIGVSLFGAVVAWCRFLKVHRSPELVHLLTLPYLQLFSLYSEHLCRWTFGGGKARLSCCASKRGV